MLIGMVEGRVVLYMCGDVIEDGGAEQILGKYSVEYRVSDKHTEDTFPLVSIPRRINHEGDFGRMLRGSGEIEGYLRADSLGMLDIEGIPETHAELRVSDSGEESSMLIRLVKRTGLKFNLIRGECKFPSLRVCFGESWQTERVFNGLGGIEAYATLKGVNLDQFHGRWWLYSQKVA